MRAPYIWRALCPCCTFPSCFQAVPWETSTPLFRENLRSYRRRNYRELSLPLFLLLFSPPLFQRVSNACVSKRGIRIRTVYVFMSHRFERSSKRESVISRFHLTRFVSGLTRHDTRAHGVKFNLRAIFTFVHGEI